jgi:hypothetical protein
MVLAEHLWGLMKSGHLECDPNPGYWRALEGMTAEGWRKLNEEADSDEDDPRAGEPDRDAVVDGGMQK